MMNNRKNAWIHFYPEGNGKAKQGYVLHHKDETLRENDPERYNEGRIEDLVMITRSEHARLHGLRRYCSSETRKKLREKNKGHVVSEETRRKLSEARKGIPSPLKGVPRSEETKRKISEAHKKRIELENQCD